MTSLGHLARNALSLAAADVVARLAGAAFAVVAARRLGAGGYGLYATVLAALLFARLLSRLGLQGPLVVRDVAERKDRASQYLSSAVLVSLPCALAIWAALPWAARALGYDPALAPLLGLVGLALVAQTLARPAEDVLRAFERMPVLMGASVALSLGTATAGIGLLALGAGLEALVLLLGVSAWVEAAVLLVLVHRGVTPLRWAPSLAALGRLAREGAWLSLLVLFEFVGTRVDVLILARLRGADAVGLYAPALRLVEYAALLRAGAAAALFPFLAARWGGDPERLGRAYREALRVYALYAVGAGVTLVFGAEAIIGLLFGAPYRPGAPALELLAGAMILDALAGPVAEVVLVHRQPLARFVPVLGGVAALNVALHVALVPRWAHVGAALATLLTAGASMVLRRHCLRPVLGREALALAPVVWRPGLGGLLMAAVFLGGRPLGFWVSLAPAGLAYLSALYWSGAFRADEVRWLRGALSFRP